MTRNESFKRRIRERMATTGEKYGAARRVLIAQAESRDARSWVADPGHSDAAIRDNSGRDWAEWRELIDAWPGHEDGHGAVASWLQDEHGVPGWWAQAVTVGWERITGRRLPHQMADGTFTANRSATITTDPEVLREMLLDEQGRTDLFPGLGTELRSRPTSKNIRLGLGDGVAEIAIAPKDDGRVTVTASHAPSTTANGGRPSTARRTGRVAEAAMAQLNHAYQLLTDDEVRKQYQRAQKKRRAAVAEFTVDDGTVGTPWVAARRSRGFRRQR